MTNNKNKIEKTIDSAQSIESYMLPSDFRQKSNFVQRLYLLLITLLYSFSIGYLLYTLIGDGSTISLITVFKVDPNLKFNFIFVFGWITTILILFQVILFNFWTRTRENKLTIFELFGFLISPAIMIAGLTYLNSIKELGENDFKDYLYILGVTQAAMAIAPAIYSLIINIIRTKIFKDAKWRTLGLLLGMIISGAGGLTQWVLIDVNSTADLILIVLSVAPVFAGFLFTVIGILITFNKSPFKSKNTIWKNYKFIGGLPSIITFGTLLGVSFRFAFEAKMEGVVLFVFIIEAALLVAISIYFWFKGRIKNITKTNPVHNEIIIKAWVVIPVFISIIGIQMMDVIQPNTKEFGSPSYAVLMITSIMVILGLSIAHFMNVITYVKFFKGTIFGIILGILVITVIILTISILPNAQSIFKILARQFMVLFLIIAPVFELIGLAFNIIYISGDSIISKKKKIRKQREKEERIMQGLEQTLGSNSTT